MFHRQHRMKVNHVWSGNSHDVFGFLSQIRFVAMYFAMFAVRFLFAKLTFIESNMSILVHLLAVEAQSRRGFVLFSAIDSQHFAEGEFLCFNAIHNSSFLLRFCTL